MQGTEKKSYVTTREEKYRPVVPVQNLQVLMIGAVINTGSLIQHAKYLLFLFTFIYDIYLYNSKSSKNAHSKGEQLKSGAGGSKVIPIGPEDLDPKIKFSSVGGLDSHIQCLKEMILLPMMYPEVFKKFLVEPPRGVLFYGPPGTIWLMSPLLLNVLINFVGTGKTLIARALANECSFGSRKVAFFMRKGADLLSKWIGESEKQLRLLFAQVKY